MDAKITALYQFSLTTVTFDNITQVFELKEVKFSVYYVILKKFGQKKDVWCSVVLCLET